MADLYFWTTPQFHLKALVSFLHLVIFVVCRQVFFFVFVPIFFIAWYCYESRWLSHSLVMTTTVHVIVWFMGIDFIIEIMVVITHFTTFCKPIYLTYLASRTQRKRIDEFPLIEKVVRKKHLFRQDRLKKEASSSFICISISYTLQNLIFWSNISKAIWTLSWPMSACWLGI